MPNLTVDPQLGPLISNDHITVNPPPHNLPKALILGLTLFVLLSVTAYGAYWYTKSYLVIPASQPTLSNVPSEVSPTKNSFESLNNRPTPPAIDETANWKTYTTNSQMDIDDAMFEKFPGATKRILTFKYPPSWQVFKLSPQLAEYVYKSTISLGFDLRKEDPKKSPCQSEGPCENFANITLRFGIIPQGTKNFDGQLWGRVYPISKEKEVVINGVGVIQAYSPENSPFPIGTIFHNSSTDQLYAVTEFFNFNDQNYETKYSKETVDEINGILSTFKFL